MLVALDNRGHGGFSGYFGFSPDAKYEVFQPNLRFIFSTETTSVEVGDTFTVHLNAENVTDLAGWQADIVFDSAVLEAVEVSEGDFLKTEGVNTFFQEGEIDNGTGKITGLKAARLSPGTVSRQGTLLAVKFTAIASGESGLTLHKFQAGSRSGKTILSIPPEMTVVVSGDAPAYPKWDVNTDGVVNILDLVMVASKLGHQGENDADVNGDGIVNILDLVKVAGELGNHDAAAPSAAQGMLEGTPTRAAVHQWLTQARHLPLTDATAQRGIRFLEQLLAALTPKETALLPNYPNPFNPETWIPYHLAEPADVTLTIYAASGVRVRTLALGHQATGHYQQRSRAAYWDGKNEVGEVVASGVYFYTLSAGDFTATGKMLIRK